MALFALYRVLPREDRLQVFFSDVRDEGRFERHHCSLQCHPDTPASLLVREIVDELGSLGFGLEFDRRTDEASEVLFFCVHGISPSGASAAEAIRAVGSRHKIAAPVMTFAGGADD